MPLLPLRTRLRLYVTLVLQALLFLVLLAASLDNFRLNNALILIPLAAAVTGLILELAARPAGRPLTLLGLSLQSLGMIGFVVMAVLTTENFFANLAGDDVLLLAGLLLPVYLLAWNFFGGRQPGTKPATP